MGFWDLFKRKKTEETPPPSPKEQGGAAPTPAGTDPPSDLPDGLARLLRVGLPGGPSDDECVAAFNAFRSTPDEARAVEELVRCAQMRKLPDPLLLVLGATLLDRGEPEGATRVLSASS